MKELVLTMKLDDEVAKRWEDYFNTINWSSAFIIEAIEQNMIRQVMGREPYDGIDVVDGYIEHNRTRGFVNDNYTFSFDDSSIGYKSEPVDLDDKESMFFDAIEARDAKIASMTETLNKIVDGLVEAKYMVDRL